MTETNLPEGNRAPSTDERRRAWLGRLVALFSLVLVGSTWRLWLPQGEFPRIPLFGLAVEAHAAWDLTAFAAMVLGSVALLLRPGGRLLVCGGLTLAVGYAAAIVLDQHRLQPWAYQFMVMGVLLASLPAAAALRLVRWITVSIYLYSAWSKLDYSFLRPGGMGERFVETLLQVLSLPVAGPRWLHWGGWTIVIGELLVAVLLLVPASRRVGIAAAALLHAALLLILGPLGMQHTPGVLWWNVFFLLLIPLVFWPPRRHSASDASPATTAEDRRGLSSIGMQTAATALAVVVIAAPLLEPWGYCDNWLAWSLYSSRNEQAILLLDPAAAQKLPPSLQVYLRDGADGQSLRFRADLWSLQRLRVPIYPENRFRLGVAQALADRYDLEEDLRVELFGASNRFNGKRPQTTVSGAKAIRQAAARHWLNSTPRRLDSADRDAAR